MRLITWNVNGLRTFMNYDPFSTFKGAYDRAFDHLGADIICLQELKTPRQNLTKPQACPTGWDAYLSLTSKGYSGVGTYTSQSTVVAQKAEEGITGFLLDPPYSALRPALRAEERVGSLPVWSELDLVDDEHSAGLASLDLEARAVLVDLGLFILINVYCPNETNDARLPFKLNFLRVLEERVRRLIGDGREVVVVGDINVVHRPEDHGEGSLASKQEGFWNHPARKWFDGLIAPKGILHDVVREAHPDRQKMFTCWDVRTEARASNYGTRLDYILVTPGLLPWIKHADIMPEVKGSDHCPVFVDFYDVLPPSSPSPSPSLSLTASNPFDPPPVSTDEHPSPARLVDVLSQTRPTDPFEKKLVGPPTAEGVRTASAPPRTCAVFYDEFSERSIKSYFGVPSASKGAEKGRGKASGGKDGKRPLEEDKQAGPSFKMDRSSTKEEPIDLTLSPPSSPTLSTSAPSTSTSTTTSLAGPSTSKPHAKSAALASSTKIKTKGKSTSTNGGRASSCSTTTKKGGQMKLSAFFNPPAPTPPPPKTTTSTKKGKGKERATGPIDLDLDDGRPPKRAKPISPPPTDAPPIPATPTTTTDESADFLFAQSLASSFSSDLPPTPKFDDGGGKKAKEEWESLLKPVSVPRCSVHGVECLERTVSKQGPNKGKRFYICSLPLGPGHNSFASKTGRLRSEVDGRFKCDFFVWKREVKG